MNLFFMGCQQGSHVFRVRPSRPHPRCGPRHDRSHTQERNPNRSLAPSLCTVRPRTPCHGPFFVGCGNSALVGYTTRRDIICLKR